MRRVVAARGLSYEVATHYVPRRLDLHLDLQVAQVVRRALEEHVGDVLCFLPGAAEIGRVQRALEGPGLAPGIRVQPLYGDLTSAAQDAAPRARGSGPAQDRTGDQHRRDQPDHRGHSRRGRLGTAALCRVRPRHGHEPARDRKSLASRGGSAPRPRRPLEFRDLLSAVVRGNAGLAGTAYSAGNHACRSRALGPGARVLGRRRCGRAALDRSSAGGPAGPGARPAAAARRHRRPGADHAAWPGPGPGGSASAPGPHAAEVPRPGGPEAGERPGGNLGRTGHPSRGARRARCRLRLRVGALRGHGHALPSGMEVDSRALAQARRTSAEWQREFAQGGKESADPHESTGMLLALAYPDRVGKARGDGARYVLANGRGARFGEPQALAKSEFIVAAELDGADREARIFLAAPIALADIERLFAAHIREDSEVAWDEREQAIRARRERRFGSLLLQSSELRHPDPAAWAAAALTGVRQLGVAALPWTRELRLWQARVSLMRQFAVPAPDSWPDLSDEALAATLDSWAPPWITGFARREHLARMDLGNALRGRLSYAQGAILEREAPTHFVVPSGSRIPIDYLDGEVPTLSVRLQELFGMQATPSIAAGRLPLLLKMLSPAGRPVQITRDLVSFWERGYHEVKKDLKGRYPKHYWPEDPYTAAPTRRVRPR